MGVDWWRLSHHVFRTGWDLRNELSRQVPPEPNFIPGFLDSRFLSPIFYLTSLFGCLIRPQMYQVQNHVQNQIDLSCTCPKPDFWFPSKICFSHLNKLQFHFSSCSKNKHPEKQSSESSLILFLTPYAQSMRKSCWFYLWNIPRIQLCPSISSTTSLARPPCLWPGLPQ